LVRDKQMQRQLTYDLATNLRRLRLARGLTQVQLAALARTRQVRIAELERGAVKDPRVSRLLALADALHCSLDELIGRRASAARKRT
jgi:transcriptional regulator with XRE-family HTH domain